MIFLFHMGLELQLLYVGLNFFSVCQYSKFWLAPSLCFSTHHLDTFLVH